MNSDERNEGSDEISPTQSDIDNITTDTDIDPDSQISPPNSETGYPGSVFTLSPLADVDIGTDKTRFDLVLTNMPSSSPCTNHYEVELVPGNKDLKL